MKRDPVLENYPLLQPCLGDRVSPMTADGALLLLASVEDALCLGFRWFSGAMVWGFGD